MKNTILLLLAFTRVAHCIGQLPHSISLDECMRLARRNYPLSKKIALIDELAQVNRSTKATARLPQLTVNGQATYQSAVTEIPIKFPNATIPSLSKDQYRFYTEVNQKLFDDGVNKLEQEQILARAKAEESELEVALYAVLDRVTQLYFGILQSQQQIEQAGLFARDINAGLETTRAAIRNGAALKSDADVLEAELLRTERRTIETRSARAAYLQMLSQYIGISLPDNTTLEIPAAPANSAAIRRPEIRVFDEQRHLLSVDEKLIASRNLPHLGLFFQGGIGRPALNLLSNQSELYYIGGVRLNWSLSGIYTAKKDRTAIDIRRKSIEVEKENFLFNTSLTLTKQDTDVATFDSLIIADQQLIALRKNISKIAKAQLEYGVIKSNDYLRELIAEDQARQDQLLHQIQLMLSRYTRQLATGLNLTTTNK